MVSETCKHHEAVEQYAHAAKSIALDNSVELKHKLGLTLFFWVVGGIAGACFVFMLMLNNRVNDNRELFYRIDKNISIIANHVGCESKMK